MSGAAVIYASVLSKSGSDSDLGVLGASAVREVAALVLERSKVANQAALSEATAILRRIMILADPAATEIPGRKITLSDGKEAIEVHVIVKGQLIRIVFPEHLINEERSAQSDYAQQLGGRLANGDENWAVADALLSKEYRNTISDAERTLLAQYKNNYVRDAEDCVAINYKWRGVGRILGVYDKKPAGALIVLPLTSELAVAGVGASQAIANLVLNKAKSADLATRTKAFATLRTIMALATGSAPELANAGREITLVDKSRAIEIFVDVDGQLTRAVLADGMTNKTRQLQSEYAEKLGGRLATRKENLAVVDNLINKAILGIINPAEKNLLDAYAFPQRNVRDQSGNVTVVDMFTRHFSDNDDFKSISSVVSWMDDENSIASPNYGALVILPSIDKKRKNARRS